MQDELLTIKEISKYLKLSPDTVYRMVKKAHIPCIKIGKKWRFRKIRIDSWLKEHERYNKKTRIRKHTRKK